MVRCCVWVPTTLVQGAREQGSEKDKGGEGPRATNCLGHHHLCGGKGEWGGKGYTVLSVWVPHLCGARGIGSKGQEYKGYTVLFGSLPPLWGQGERWSKGNKAPESNWGPKAGKGFWRLPRLPEAPGRSQGTRETQGARGARRWGSKENKAPESEVPRLLKASKGSQRLPEVPGGHGGFGGKGAKGKQDLWVWLRPQGWQRLPNACKVSWGPKEAIGSLEMLNEHKGEGNMENKVPESDWGPKAAKGFLRPRGLTGEGGQGGEGEWWVRGWGSKGNKAWVWLRLQGYQRLPEAPGRSQGARETNGARRWGVGRSKGNKGPESDQGPKVAECFQRLSGSQGGFGAKEIKENKPWLSLTEVPRVLKAPKAFWRPS